MEPRKYVLTLAVVVLVVPGLSCADDDEPEPEPELSPTREEMQQVAAEFCEHGIGCGFIPHDVTIDECIANQVGTYQDAPECVARYYLDECLTTQTCEEIERLTLLRIGDCLDEREETDKVACDPPPL